MAVRVDNLSNLFWDNGSARFPNTHPFLVNGQYLENITPVMTSPVTGWVVLTGEFNYCEYAGELFFLKKDVRISEKKNKWRYILIKDHICTLFKNKANIIINGTLTNASLEKLQDTDFQFTLPVFTNFNKRILLPLNKQIYNWKKHIIPNLPNKIFDSILAVDNKDYSIFLRQLENNKEKLKNVKFTESKYFTLLGRAKLNKKSHNWKNQLVSKIKDLLSNLEDEDLILAKFNADFGGSKFLQNKYVITHNSYSLGVHKEEFKQVLNLDFSGLKDIELVNLSTGNNDLNTAYFYLNLSEVPVDESRENIIPTYIKKLTPRNRVSFLNAYSTRAIYERNGRLRTWFNTKDGAEFLYPQKIYFKTSPSLLAKTEWQRYLPSTRKFESFRSVYLYSIRNLDFVYKFNTAYDQTSNPNGLRLNEYSYKELNFIDPERYLKDNSNKSIADKYILEASNGILVKEPLYKERAPWTHLKEPLNIGWLVGQFSIWLNNQDTYFESDKPFIVKKPFNKLRRIKGLNKLVSRLVQNEDAYEPTAIRDEKNFHFTLDIFSKLSARARQATQEADFLIGEKLLFTSWGLPSYLLFQPLGPDGYDAYTISALDKDNALLSRWLIEANWFYWYSLFDEGTYISEWTKQWFKMGYSNFDNLEYKRFYANPQNFKELKTHIKRNTNAYFISEEVDFLNTPIKDCKKGDIFFSDLDYFFFDYGEALEPKLNQEVYDWYTHIKDGEADLNDGEIVVYHDIQEGGIAIGKVSVWDSEVILPDGQFISEGKAIENDSSNLNSLRTKLTKITKLWRNESFEEVINYVRNRPQDLFNGIIDFNLDDLKGKPYLFDLKGTDFYCFLDSQGRVNLIFKESERDVKESQKQIYAISTNQVIEKLDKAQWVNQKVNLSIYGQKIELPVKAFAKKILVTIELDTANLERRGQEALDSHKVEITHALGKTYCRFDTSKLNTIGTAQFNVFDIERTDMMNARASQDYLIKRREFEIGNEQMQLEHRKMRFENQMAKNELITNTIIGGIGTLVTGVTAGLGVYAGLGKMASTALSAGASRAMGIGIGATAAKQGLSMISNLTGSAFKLAKFSEVTERMEQQIGIQIEKQAINSYTLDLGFQRQKEDYEFNLRKLFNQQNIHQTSSRERNLALDDKEVDLQELKNKADKEIYLEIWTISDKQKEYAAEYHKEYGVDCRITNYLIPFGNGMKTGVYRLESVEIKNLSDRIDLLLIKGLFENGVQIVEWIEHEKVKELIPEDPRIGKLQRQIEESEAKRRELENQKHLLDIKIQELTVEIQNSKEQEEILTQEVSEKKKELLKTQEDLNVVTQQLKYETEKYDSLAVGYRTLEQQKATEERLKNLYLDEKKKFSSQLNQQKRIVASLTGEKKELEISKNSLENKIQEINSSLQLCTKNKDELNNQLQLKQKENEAQKLQIDSLLIKERELEEIKKENLELKAKQDASTGDVLLDTYKAVDYLITKKNDKLVITAWNKEKNIWQEQPDLIVKRRNETKLLRIAYEDEKFVTNQYPFWSWYTNEHHDKFNIKVSTFNILEGYVNNTKLKQAHSWVGRYSVEIDKNIPYLDTAGNWVKPYWYHSTKGWFDYDIGEGARKINSYEEYLELSKNALTELKKEVEEKDNTIKALRELESAPKESKELTDNDLILLVNYIFLSSNRLASASSENLRYKNINKLLIITKDSGNGLIYLVYDGLSYLYKTELKIWAYDSYKAFSVSQRTDNKLTNYENNRAYWKTLNSGYFTRRVTHWGGQGASALTNWVYIGDYMLEIIEEVLWPYFEVYPNNDEDLVINLKPIYYSKKSRIYTYNVTDTPVKNKADYKRTLRMMFSPN